MRGVSSRSVMAVLVTAVAAVVTIGVLAAMDWPGSSYWRGDHVVFWAGSRALLEGASPYDATWWDALPEREGRPPLALPYRPPGGAVVTTGYPLWTFIVLLPFGALPFETAAAAWLVAQLLVVALALVALSAALLRARRDAVLLFGLAAGFQPVWILAGNGNMTGFLFGALAGALVALRSRRPYLAGICLGLLLLKPHPFALVPIAAFMAAERRASVAAGAVTTAALLVAVSFIARPAWAGEWIAQLGAAGSAGLSTSTAWGLERLTGLPLTAPVAVALAIGAFAAWWYLRRPALDAVFAAAIAVSLFVAPYGWSYDHLHLLIAAAVILRRLELAPALRPAGLAMLAAIAGPLPWAFYAAAFVRGGEELAALVPLSFGVLLVVADHAARTRAPVSGGG